MGSRMFWKTQYAKEATKGTPVAATKIWPGAITVPDDISPLYPNHNLAVRVKASESAAFQTVVDGITLSDEQAAFQSLLMPLSTTVLGGITPTEVTSTKGDWKWAFSPSMTAGGDTLDAATLQYGDDDQAYRSEYFIGRRILIKGALGQNQGVSLECEGFARQSAKNAFTPALTLPAWTMMNPNTAQFWMDPTYAALGTTEQTNLLRDFEIEIQTGTHPKWLGNNSLFTKHGNGYISAQMRFTLEGGASAVALYDLYRTRAAKAFRFKLTGPLVAAGATAHSLQVDMWGDLMVSPLSGDTDGNTLYKAAVSNLYDPISAKSVEVTVVTGQPTPWG